MGCFKSNLKNPETESFYQIKQNQSVVDQSDLVIGKEYKI